MCLRLADAPTAPPVSGQEQQRGAGRLPRRRVEVVGIIDGQIGRPDGHRQVLDIGDCRVGQANRQIGLIVKHGRCPLARLGRQGHGGGCQRECQQGQFFQQEAGSGSRRRTGMQGCGADLHIALRSAHAVPALVRFRLLPLLASCSPLPAPRLLNGQKSSNRSTAGRVTSIDLAISPKAMPRKTRTQRPKLGGRRSGDRPRA